MQTQQAQASKSLHPLIWVAAIALIVLCAAGIAAVMGWIPGSAGKPGEPPLAAKVEKPRPAASSRAAAVCAECGVVQSVREIDTKGEASGVGAVGGAVVGGVLGNQVVRGDNRKVATVGGAVVGAVVGNEIEKHVKSTKSYEITVRFDDGTSRVITEANESTWRAGDKVKLVNGALQAKA
jgi:outer membrane lipoprotein SlyB